MWLVILLDFSLYLSYINKLLIQVRLISWLWVLTSYCNHFFLINKIMCLKTDKILTRIQSWGGCWINPAGKSVLLKYVLSSLSIFQCSVLLAPKGTFKKHSRALWSFLWVGGKINTKTFHLLNWKQVCQPLNKGGLVIRDPILMSTSLGENLAWCLITGIADWCYDALISSLPLSLVLLFGVS